MRQQCTACEEMFSGLTAFDRHRVGKHGINRRCLTRDEMIEDGMVNRNGIWGWESMPTAVLNHYKEIGG